MKSRTGSNSAKPSAEDLKQAAIRQQMIDDATARVSVGILKALGELITSDVLKRLVEREARTALQALLIAEDERRRSEPPQVIFRDLPPDREAYRVPEVAKLLATSTSKIWKLIAERELVARKLGSSTVILRKDLDAFVAGLRAVAEKL